MRSFSQLEAQAVPILTPREEHRIPTKWTSYFLSAALAHAITILALWWALTVLVTRPVARLSEMAEEISKGHLSSSQIPVRGRDEIAQLTASFNRMNQSLYKAVKRLKGS